MTDLQGQIERTADLFDRTSTTTEVLAGIDLTGRLALVTGGNAGLGRETARALASAGADVVIGGRSPATLEEASRAIADQYRDVTVHAFPLDLASLASVRAFAGQVLALGRPLDLFVANAGIMAVPLQYSTDGIELQFASNYGGHALLLSLLSPAIRASDGGRIVSLSSSGHHYLGVDLDDLNWKQRPYDAWHAYGQSKTACSLLAVKAHAAMSADGVTALAVHPGVIRTGLMGHLRSADYAALKVRTDVRPPMNPFLKTVEQGAATSVWAATAPELAGRFAYLEDCAIAKPTDIASADSGVMAYALDPEMADRLWAATEGMIGHRLPL